MPIFANRVVQSIADLIRPGQSNHGRSSVVPLGVVALCRTLQESLVRPFAPRRRRVLRVQCRAAEKLESRELLTIAALSVAADGTTADGRSDDPHLSRDGRYVAFQSGADDLAPVSGSDANGVGDIFVRNLDEGTITLVSVTPGGRSGDGASFSPSISDDGRFVAFGSSATNLVAGVTVTAGPNVYVHDRDFDGDGIYDEAGETRTRLLSRDGTMPELSGSFASGGSLSGPGWSNRPVISGDGSAVAYVSFATNLLSPDDGVAVGAGTLATSAQVYVTQTSSGKTKLVSIDFTGTMSGVLPGSGSSRVPSISSDGRFIAFESDYENLVKEDDEGVRDIFLRDVVMGTTTRVSLLAAGLGGNGESFEPVISRNGRHVVFRSRAENLVEGDTNGTEDIFVYDAFTKRTTLVSVALDIASTSSTGNAASPSTASPDEAGYDISDSGRYVLFTSLAGDLLDASGGITDTNGTTDVYLFDRDADGDGIFDEVAPSGTATTLVSINSDGTDASDSLPVTGGSSAVSISGDGRFALFTCPGGNLVKGEPDGTGIYVRDLSAGMTEFVAPAGTDAALQAGVAESAISTSPFRVAFTSFTAGLDPDIADDNVEADLFIFEGPTDIRFGAATADGNEGVALRYDIDNTAADAPFEVGVYMSADGMFSPTDDDLIDTIEISGSDLETGLHVLVLEIGDGPGELALPGAGVPEVDFDYQILFVLDHLNGQSEIDSNPFNEDNTGRLQGIYHPPGGPVFVHGRTSPVRENDRLRVTEVDDSTLEIQLGTRRRTYDPADVTSIRFRGHEGNDFVQAAGGDDLLLGGAGADTIFGGAGGDTIDGGPGNDRLFGEAGFDVIFDGMDDDYVDLGQDGGTILATPGSDDIFLGLEDGSLLDFSFADHSITIDLDLDVIQTVDDDDNTVTLKLEDFDFDFLGSVFDDVVFVEVEERDRVFKGGDGNDRINIDAGGDSITFDGTTLTPASGGTITLIGFEDINIFNFPPIVFDDSDPGFSDTGFFHSNPDFPQGVNGGVRFGTAGSGATATWTFSDVLPGLYNLSATWTSAPDRATNTRYEIKSGSEVLLSTVVNQELPPDDFSVGGVSWDFLTEGIPLDGVENLTVTVFTLEADEFVSADAIRIAAIDPASGGRPPQLTIHQVNADAGQTTQIHSGTTVHLGDVPHAADDTARLLTRRLILQNSGEANLLLDEVTVNGPFIITQSTHELPENGAGNVRITLDSNATGTHFGQVIIPSNDPTAPSFVFDVTATIVDDNVPPGGKLTFAGAFLDAAAVELFPDLGGGNGYSIRLSTQPSEIEGQFLSNRLTTLNVTPTTAISQDQPVRIGNSAYFIPIFEADGSFHATVEGTAVDIAGNSSPILPLEINIQIDPVEVTIAPLADGIDPFNDAFFNAVADVSLPFQVAQVEFRVNGVVVDTVNQEPFIGQIPQLESDLPTTISVVALDTFGTEHASTLLELNPAVTTGTVSGQKWNDLNGNGGKDTDEPGLNGWMIEVVGNDGQVIATTMTADSDLNNDNQIDPSTEAGLYRVDVPAGSWTVREIPQDGWRQTFPDGDPLEAAAFDFDREFQLKATLSDFQDWGGLNEKWFYSGLLAEWVFVVPDGGVFRWDRSGKDNLTGTKLLQLDSSFHEDIARIHAARNPRAVVVQVESGQTINEVSFGAILSGVIEGRIWNDVNANGDRETDEPGLNGWMISLEDDAGNVIDTAVTHDRDLNGDQQIDPETEAGWYVFEGLSSGSFVVGEEDRTGWTQTFPQRQVAQTAYDLDVARNFRATENDFRNWGGRDERWFFGNNGWYFITPVGDLFQWDGSPRTALNGTLIASLNSDYWNYPERIHSAVTPGKYRVDLIQRVSGIDFGNVEDLDL